MSLCTRLLTTPRKRVRLMADLLQKGTIYRLEISVSRTWICNNLTEKFFLLMAFYIISIQWSRIIFCDIIVAHLSVKILAFIRIFIKLERESGLRERLWIKGASISLALSRVEKRLLPRLSWISRLHGVSFFTQDRRTDESPEIVSSFLFLNCRNSFVKKINLRDVSINVHIYNGLNLVFRVFWDT